MKRNLLKVMLGICLTILLTACGTTSKTDDPWVKMQETEAAIQLTSFPDAEFPVTNYGATADTDISEALTQAIAECHQKGGGKV